MHHWRIFSFQNICTTVCLNPLIIYHWNTSSKSFSVFHQGRATPERPQIFNQSNYLSQNRLPHSFSSHPKIILNSTHRTTTRQKISLASSHIPWHEAHLSLFLLHRFYISLRSQSPPAAPVTHFFPSGKPRLHHCALSSRRLGVEINAGVQCLLEESSSRGNFSGEAGRLASLLHWRRRRLHLYTSSSCTRGCCAEPQGSQFVFRIFPPRRGLVS